jgi:hypothetical protein
MRVAALVVAASVVIGCASKGPPEAKPGVTVADGWLRVHDDVWFELTPASKHSAEAPIDRYEVRKVEEPLAPGETLEVRLVTKILNETERTTLVQDPNAIGEVWPNSYTLARSELVKQITDRAWQAVDYDPSGLAHEDFEGGHSTYRTPTKLTLSVAFVHHGALIVVHAAIVVEPRGDEPEEAALRDKYVAKLERVLARLRR